MQIYLNMDASKVLGAISSHDAHMRHAIDRWQDVAGGVVLREAERLSPFKTGRLRKSLFAESHGTVIRVGTRMPYAKYVVNGTRPHMISPMRGKALRFFIRGQVVFSKGVRHPGTRPNRFLQKALENKREFVTALLKQYVTQETQLLD